LLRCDDKEKYKTVARKQLRDWVKEHIPASQGSSSVGQQENHDACEWLILHVVVSDTVAASEPRANASGKDSASAQEKASSSSRWPGKGSSTILEKLKSDFNESSKHGAERVAQIRLPKNAIPADTTSSATPGLQNYEMSPQEQEQSWDDLVQKMKSLILMSFDLRVHQYEEDIREREAQRALPGWNFCTFFLLKEGLARGFESVGLVDDALVGYDELAAGLDAIIRDQSTDALENQAGAFLDITEELKSLLEFTAQKIDGHQEKAPKLHQTLFDQPLSTSRKDYRELILANNISIFDFKCYIFSRQMALLLRLSNVRRHSKKPLMDERSLSEPPASQRLSGRGLPGGSSPRSDDSQDLPSLGEFCTRALSFIPSAARIMREDIGKTYAHILIYDLVRPLTIS
jgi:trafficking protein particle complex subunit 10